MTDRMTSEGWTRKTNFREAAVRCKVARENAHQFMKLGIKEYSQWFPGKENNLANALSQDNNRKDEELTHDLCACVPSQMPPVFKI